MLGAACDGAKENRNGPTPGLPALESRDGGRNAGSRGGGGAATSDAPGPDPCCQCLATHCGDLVSQCQSDVGCAGSYSTLCPCEADAGDTSTNCFIFFGMDGPLQQAIIQCAQTAPCCIWH